MTEVRGPVTRDVDIAPRSARDELVTVIRLAMTVVFGVWLYLASQGTMTQPKGGSQAKGLLPFQFVLVDRPPDEHRMFRLLQVALLEAENIRATTGAWPGVETMAADGIEPFAPDPTNRGVTYQWQHLASGRTVGYLGRPSRQDAPAWLLFIQEPDASVPPEPFQNDEEHHRLVDGVVLHVSLWVRSASLAIPTALPRLPQAEGWSQLFAVGPSATH